MAGDWLKMRLDLATDPAVIGVASTLEVEEDLVVGKLHRLWSWANRQTIDGNAPSVTKTWVDRYLGVTGFADALIEQGWLAANGHGITFPKFDKHNSDSAKRRALTAIRVASYKAKKGNAKSVTSALPREEKKREEKKTATTVPGGGGGGAILKAMGVKKPPDGPAALVLAAWARAASDPKVRSVPAVILSQLLDADPLRALDPRIVCRAAKAGIVSWISDGDTRRTLDGCKWNDKGLIVNGHVLSPKQLAHCDYGRVK